MSACLEPVRRHGAQDVRTDVAIRGPIDADADAGHIVTQKMLHALHPIMSAPTASELESPLAEGARQFVMHEKGI